MNQKVKRIWVYSALCFMLLCFFILARSDSHAPLDDVWSYAGAFETGNISDWHSSLFMYEGYFFLRIIRIFWEDAAGMDVIKIFYILSQICTAICLSYMLKKLSDHDYFYSILGVLLGIFFIVCQQTRLYLCYNYYIDCYFMAWLLIAITVPLLLPSKEPHLKALLWLILVIALIHIFHLRKNAILLVPVILPYAICISSKSSTSRLIKAIVFAFLISVPLFATNYCLPAKHTHSTLPMLASNLKDASLLRGEGKEEQAFLAQLGIGYDTVNDDDVIGPLFFCKTNNLNEERWDKLVCHYKNEWIDNFPSMAAAKTIEIFQFMTYAYLSSAAREFICSYFPACSPNGREWNWTLPTAFVKKYPAWERLAIYFITLLSTIYAVSAIRKNGYNIALAISIICGLSALVYILSFIPVTPTPDARYHSPSVLLCLISISCSLIYICLESRNKNQTIKARET